MSALLDAVRDGDARLSDEIAEINVHAFMCPPLPRRKGDAAERKFKYEGYDFLTLEREFADYLEKQGR